MNILSNTFMDIDGNSEVAALCAAMRQRENRKNLHSVTIVSNDNNEILSIKAFGDTSSTKIIYGDGNRTLIKSEMCGGIQTKTVITADDVVTQCILYSESEGLPQQELTILSKAEAYALIADVAEDALIIANDILGQYRPVKRPNPADYIKSIKAEMVPQNG